MSSDTAQPEQHPDPRDGAAVIPPVTDAMLDHAAHEAAVLADGVAHGTIAPQDAAEPAAAEEPPEPAAAAAPEPASVAPLESAVTAEAEPAAGVRVETTRDAAATADTAVSQAADAAAPSPDEADAVSRYGTRVLEMMRANLAATTAHVVALVQAKSVPDALSLNAEHLRQQTEVLAGQGRELATLAQRIALDALQPFKGPSER